jgi:hypothetical protein
MRIVQIRGWKRYPVMKTGVGRQEGCVVSAAVLRQDGHRVVQ